MEECYLIGVVSDRSVGGVSVVEGRYQRSNSVNASGVDRRISACRYPLWSIYFHPWPWNKLNYMVIRFYEFDRFTTAGKAVHGFDSRHKFTALTSSRFLAVQ